MDTQAWIWWVSQSGPAAILRIAASHETEGLAVSEISAWEVAKKVSVDKLDLELPLDDWLALATTSPGVTMLPVDQGILVDSTRLPGSFHKDPADQIIVATALRTGLRLLTTDRKILEYPHIQPVRA